jgi:hypothetical protein
MNGLFQRIFLRPLPAMILEGDSSEDLRIEKLEYKLSKQQQLLHFALAREKSSEVQVERMVRRT